MATGRIGVTPTLRTRWSKAPAGGTTSLSGLDDNSVSLVYDVGYEAVYRNGVLLSRTNDYTATTGNSITLIDATIAGDIIEVFANQLLPLTNAIGNGQYTAKGALLSATAASTPAVLTVGSNDQVLTADSSTATGLKWAAAGGGDNFTLLNAGGTALTGAQTITVSGISSKNKIMVLVSGASASASSFIGLRLNADTGNNYNFYGNFMDERSDFATSLWEGTKSESTDTFTLARLSTNATSIADAAAFISGCNSSGVKVIQSNGGANPATESLHRSYNLGGYYNSSSTITSVSVVSSIGNFDAGTVYVYTSA